MKTIYYFSILFFSISLSNYSQCTANAAGFGNNSSTAMYNVLGSISVVLNSSNSVSLNLASNFATASGPDVRVYLVARGSLTNAMLKVPSNFLALPKIEMGLISGNGAATFTKAIPAGMNISDFNTVYFFCQQFDQFWDFGSIMPFTNANCASLANNTFEKEGFSIYPNPVNDILNIDLSSFEGINTINIYNNVGLLVSTNTKSTIVNNQLDIAELTTGIYLLEIVNADNNRLIKKFLKN